MQWRAALARYWPVALFVAGNVVAVALVVKAQRGYEPLPAPAAPATVAAATKSDSERLLGALDTAAEGSADSPLLFDWGKEFSGAPPKASPPSARPGLLARIAAGLGAVRRAADESVRAEERARREQELLGRRLASNLFSGLDLPRWNALPDPLVPTMPVLGTTRDLSPFSTALGDDREVTIHLDPTKYRDEATAWEEAARLVKLLADKGLRARLVLGDRPGVTPPGVARENPRIVATPLRLTGLNPLPAPPPDVALPSAGPNLPPLPGSPAPEPGPRAPRTSASSDGRSAPEPSPTGGGSPKGGATDAGGRPALPSTEPRSAEPVRSFTAQFQHFNTRDQADKALARLRALGYEGSVTQTRDGLDWFVVQFKVAARRSEVKQVLGRITAETGWQAWLN
jgi:hypothetical protein